MIIKQPVWVSFESQSTHSLRSMKQLFLSQTRAPLGHIPCMKHEEPGNQGTTWVCSEGLLSENLLKEHRGWLLHSLYYKLMCDRAKICWFL
jgi:hypothetical protein